MIGAASLVIEITKKPLNIEIKALNPKEPNKYLALALHYLIGQLATTDAERDTILKSIVQDDNIKHSFLSLCDDRFSSFGGQMPAYMDNYMKAGLDNGLNTLNTYLNKR